MPNINLRRLFETEPATFGLRGDETLWRAMRERLDGTRACTLDEMRSAVHEAFESLAGQPWTTKERFHCQGLDTGRGMSSGMVSPEFWHGDGIRTLEERMRWARATAGLLAGWPLP